MNFLKILSVSIFLLILFWRCSNNQNSGHRNEQALNGIPSQDTLILKTKSTFTFNYDLNDYNGFGIQFFDHDLPVGPQDVLIADTLIYILDRYHNNIKKVDCQGNILSASIPLSDKNIWLKQFEILKENIFVISELDSLYIFSKNLELLDRKYLQKGNPRIFHKSSERIVLYYPMNGHEFIQLNENGDIINRISGIEHKSDFQSNVSYSNTTIAVSDFVFVTRPVDLRELTHSIEDRIIVSISTKQSQLNLDLYTY